MSDIEAIRAATIKECHDYLTHYAANNVHIRHLEKCEVENRAILEAVDQMTEDLADHEFKVQWKSVKGWQDRIAEIRKEYDERLTAAEARAEAAEARVREAFTAGYCYARPDTQVPPVEEINMAWEIFITAQAVRTLKGATDGR